MSRFVHRWCRLALVTCSVAACTNTIEGLPPEELAAGSGSALGGTSPTGGASAANSVGGTATTAGGVGGSSGATTGGGGDPGATSTGGITSTGGVTSTGGTGFSGSAGNAGGVGSASGIGAGGVGGAGLGGAGGAAGSRVGSETPSFSAVRTLITQACAAATCHGGRRNPNLSTASLYTTLTNTAVRQCSSDRLVTPRDPANSAILELVQGQCGNFVMPDGCDTLPCIDADSIQLLTAWITAGAPQ